VGHKAAVAYLHPGDVSAAFSMSLLKLMLHETGRTGMPPLVIANRCSSGALVKGRNEIVANFLDRTTAQWLLFVDSDMGFAPDALEQLLAAAHKTERPIVGGLCFGLRREGSDPDTHAERFRCFPTVYQWAERDDAVGFRIIADYPRGELVTVGATGAAFVLIHRGALEKIRAAHGDEWYSQITHPTGPTTFSEDMSFCIRAQACDLPIHVDTAVKTCHDKGGIFLDETTFDRQQALDAPTRTAEVPTP
jgi:hypothetical protein